MFRSAFLVSILSLTCSIAQADQSPNPNLQGTCRGKAAGGGEYKVDFVSGGAKLFLDGNLMTELPFGYSEVWTIGHGYCHQDQVFVADRIVNGNSVGFIEVHVRGSGADCGFKPWGYVRIACNIDEHGTNPACADDPDRYIDFKDCSPM